MSETLGRLPVYTGTLILGSLFTLGAGFTHNFGALCFLRFAAGFCWAPALAIGAGSVAETFASKVRGPMMAVYVLMPFLGPGFGCVFQGCPTWLFANLLVLVIGLYSDHLLQVAKTGAGRSGFFSSLLPLRYALLSPARKQFTAPSNENWPENVASTSIRHHRLHPALSSFSKSGSFGQCTCCSRSPLLASSASMWQ